MEKYFLWIGNEKLNYLGFSSFDKALNVALEIKTVTEIEKAIWYDEEDYQNGEPADEFKIVWGVEK